MKPILNYQPSSCRIVHLNLSGKNQLVNDNKLIVSDSNSTYLIHYTDILYCKAEGNYTTIYTINRPPVTTSIVLKEIESRVPQYLFLRVHQSYLIQLDAVCEISQCKVVLSEGSVVPISRRRKKLLLKSVLS